MNEQALTDFSREGPPGHRARPCVARGPLLTTSTGEVRASQRRVRGPGR